MSRLKVGIFSLQLDHHPCLYNNICAGESGSSVLSVYAGKFNLDVGVSVTKISLLAVDCAVFVAKDSRLFALSDLGSHATIIDNKMMVTKKNLLWCRMFLCIFPSCFHFLEYGAKQPNGLRYPQVGGVGQGLRCRKNSKPEKCL